MYVYIQKAWTGKRHLDTYLDYQDTNNCDEKRILIRLVRSMKGIDMNTKLLGLALACLAGLSTGSASAGVVVAFSHPEKFQEMPFLPSDREQVLKELSEHFESLGKRMAAGQELRIEVLDFAMAGRILPNFRGREDLRVVRGTADWPRIVMRYELLSNGHVVASGQENLSDMGYRDRINRYMDGDVLRYEKRMIDEWFIPKFAPRKSG
jgi:hypothetical protein